MHLVSIFHLDPISFLQAENARLAESWSYVLATAAKLKVTPSFRPRYLLLSLELLGPSLFYHAGACSGYFFQQLSSLWLVESQYAHLFLFSFGRRIELLLFACPPRMDTWLCLFFILFFDQIESVVNSTTLVCLPSSFNSAITADSLGIFDLADNLWAAAKSGYVTLILWKYAASRKSAGRFSLKLESLSIVIWKLALYVVID